MTAKSKLYTRLAEIDADIVSAQRLRFQVFYEERGRAPENALEDRDIDGFDVFSDHLLVFRQLYENGPSEEDELVGTYRLLRQKVAEQHGGFYSQQEFDLVPLLTRKAGLNFLELGRSCVRAEFRSMPVIGLLWQGIWDYVRKHRLDVMVGCASLDGTDPKPHRATLNFLARHAAATADWQVSVHADHRLEMLDPDMPQVDLKKVLRVLPPLVRGYLGLGAMVGDGAFIDHHFDTIDVLIVLPVSNINPRYFSHFGQPG